MLTADLTASSGDAYLAGYNVVSERSTAMKQLGFCPQFDALFDELTPIEHLRLYGILKGVPAKDVDARYAFWVLRVLIGGWLTRGRARAFVDGLGLGEYANRQSSKLSGGTKRKLSFAIAMVGNPAVVTLDEPSTGYVKKYMVFNAFLMGFSVFFGVFSVFLVQFV